MANSTKRYAPSKVSMRLYKDQKIETANRYRKWASNLAEGDLSLSAFEQLMRVDLKKYQIRVALLGSNGRKMTTKGRADLSKFLAKSYQYLDGFIGDLKTGYKAKISQAQAEARAASYAGAWGIYTRYTIPGIMAEVLPALPGIDCLGAGDCGCWLEWSVVSDTEIDLHWFLLDGKEHCENCVSFAMKWNPLKIDLPKREDMDEEDWQEMQDWLF